jgi:hypothetical protein
LARGTITDAAHAWTGDPVGIKPLAADTENVCTGPRATGGIDPARVIAVTIIRTDGDTARFGAVEYTGKHPPVNKVVRRGAP